MESMSKGVQILRTQEGYKSLAKEVKKVALAGKVLLFGAEGRETEDAACALALEGYSIRRMPVSEEYVMRYKPSAEEDMGAVTAAVAVGGLSAMEAGKVFAARGSIPTFLFPTDFSGLSAFKSDAALATSNHLLTVRSACFAVVADEELARSQKGFRAGLGYMLARLVELFDGAYAYLVEGKGDLARFLSVASDALTLWREVSREDPARALVECVIKLEEEAREQSLPSVPSATTFAFLAAKKQGGRYDDFLFPAAYALLSLYRSYLSDLPLERCVPTDRLEAVEALCACHAEIDLAKEDKTYADGYLTRQYITGEYRDDAMDVLSEGGIPLAALCRLYRRAAKGEREGDPSSETLLRLFSLTGEAVSGYALIKHIGLTGLLEPLSDCA